MMLLPGVTVSTSDSGSTITDAARANGVAELLFLDSQKKIGFDCVSWRFRRQLPRA